MFIGRAAEAIDGARMLGVARRGEGTEREVGESEARDGVNED